MTKLARFLRPYLKFCVLVFVFLVIQALTNLLLPDLMSRIVNVGIQQNGIKDAQPQVLTAAGYSELANQLPDDAAFEFINSYRQIDVSELSPKDKSDLIARYPLAANETLWFLKDDLKLSARTIEEIEDIWAQADPDESQGLKKQQAIARLSAEYETIGIDLASVQRRSIFSFGGLMLLVTVLGSACAVLVSFLTSRLAAGAARDIRLAVFSQVESFGNTEFDRFSTASLITRTTNDIQQVQMAIVVFMRILFFAPIMGIGGVIMALSTNLAMSWLIGLIVVIMLMLAILIFLLIIPRFKRIQILIDEINRVTREFLSGLLVIRAFNTQKHEEERFDRANSDLTGINLFINRLVAAAMPLMMLFMNTTAVAIVWVGARQIDSGAMQVGDIMAFVQYMMLIIMSFLMISAFFVLLPRAEVSAQRINAILATEPAIRDPKQPLPFSDDQKGTVVFDRVTFSYPNAQQAVLNDISFTAEPGRTTAIIGSTGCGKTTLVNLIPRLYDVTSGAIFVNGVDVRKVRQSDLRDRIGFIPQKGVLFSGTIRDNIAYGRRNADEKAIRKAAATAQALSFITDSPAGLDSEIAQGGDNVSGGQKQRLAIARALVKNPDIYIFDDSFSALDYKTDAALRRALKEDAREATVIIVAQRISTILKADQILVLDEGRLAGRGTHSELLQTCFVYREIAKSQLPKEELV